MKRMKLAIVMIAISLAGVAVLQIGQAAFALPKCIAEAEKECEVLYDRLDRCESMVWSFAKSFSTSCGSADHFLLCASPLNSDLDFVAAEWLVNEAPDDERSPFKVRYSSREKPTEIGQPRILTGALKNAKQAGPEALTKVFFSERFSLFGDQPVVAAVAPIHGPKGDLQGLAVAYFRAVFAATQNSPTSSMKIYRLADGGESSNLVASSLDGGGERVLLQDFPERGPEKYRIEYRESKRVVDRRTSRSYWGLLIGPLVIFWTQRAAWKRMLRQLEWKNHDLTDEVQERREMQQTLQSLLQLREQERRLVSSDIHDGFVQEAISAQMFLEALAARISNRDQLAKQQLAKAQESIEQAILEGRRLVNRNQVLAVDEFGFFPAVKRLLASQGEKYGLQVALRFPTAMPELDILKQRAIYRMLQEALCNVRRHSGAEEAMVTFFADDEWFTMDVVDQGCGFEIDDVRDESYGIQGIRERARGFDGEVTIKSEVGEGTIVSVRIPICESIPGTSDQPEASASQS